MEGYETKVSEVANIIQGIEKPRDMRANLSV
jgi:hypothetical protein